MGKFREPVWLGITVQDSVVRGCFPHLWGTHRAGDLCEDIVYPEEPVTICMHCFIERCPCTDRQSRCLLPRDHARTVQHVNEGNHTW